MHTLYSWIVKRAGSSMTITHSTGKVTDIVAIEPQLINGIPHIVATHSTGRGYSLAAPDA